MKKIIFPAVFILTVLLGGLISAIFPQVSLAQTNNNDVNLAKVLLTMPGQANFINNDVPLVGARWIDGSFVISGYCSGNNNSKGLWIFNGSGNQVAAKDICRDAGEGANGSLDHTWSVMPNVQPADSGTFVKEMSPNNDRPPLLYRTSDGSLVSKAWNAPGTGGRNGNGVDTTDNIAAIPGYAVALENGRNNVLFGLPGWNVLQRTSAMFVPITGVGNYIVGTPITGNRDLVLYKVANNSLQLINKVNTNIRPVAAAIDASSSGSRVGFLFLNDGSAGNHVDIYSVAESGLSFVRKVSLPSTATFSSTGWQGALAISGDYTAFVDCGLSALSAPSGNSDNIGSSRCGLAVLNGSTRLNVQRLPFAVAQDGSQIIPPTIRGIAMSPSGAIAVTNFHGAYLYQVGGAPSNIPPDTLPPDGGPTGTPQMPGQMISVTYGATSTVPAVLIRYASFGSAGTNSFTLSIFGQNYTIDTSRARIVRNNWSAGALSDFTSGSYVNVYGAMDLADATLIHAETVRNPMPAGVSGLNNLSSPAGGFSGNASNNNGLTSGLNSSVSGSSAGVTNAATQTQLNNIMKALQNLKLRLSAQ